MTTSTLKSMPWHSVKTPFRRLALPTKQSCGLEAGLSLAFGRERASLDGIMQGSQIALQETRWPKSDVIGASVEPFFGETPNTRRISPTEYLELRTEHLSHVQVRE
jgi:hypothetical protein